MRLVDLFSGIGGFSLAASWVWGDDLDIACFCERDEFCRKVLKKHWPNVPIVGDVYDLESIVAYANRVFKEQPRSSMAGRHSMVETNTSKPQSFWPNRTPREVIDLLTAGFPCQPASTAGQRKGTEDDRWLWPPLLAAIREIKPRWCILENVPGLLSLDAGLVFEQCCADLEAEGYEVQPLLIPACGVNAPHRRERLWIVGHSTQQRCGSRRTESEGQQRVSGTNGSNCHAADTQKHTIWTGQQQKEQTTKRRQRPIHATSNVTHTAQQRPQVREVQPRDTREERKTTIRNPWHEHWYEAAARLCTVDDGLPGRLVLPGWRVNALKAAGNSIVPQVAARIMQAIKETDTWAMETKNQKNC